MGTNCGPQVANIYLHVYEHKYICSLIEKYDKFSLRKLQNIFRFQDDLLSINDGGLLGDIMSDVYPGSEMIVNCTNVSSNECNYRNYRLAAACDGEITGRGR